MTVITLERLVVTRVKPNWYIGRVHGAAFFSRSRSEVHLAYRRWRQQKDQARAVNAHFNNVVAMVAKAKEVG